MKKLFSLSILLLTSYAYSKTITVVNNGYMNLPITVYWAGAKTAHRKPAVPCNDQFIALSNKLMAKVNKGIYVCNTMKIPVGQSASYTWEDEVKLKNVYISMDEAGKTYYYVANKSSFDNKDTLYFPNRAGNEDFADLGSK